MGIADTAMNFLSGGAGSAANNAAIGAGTGEFASQAAASEAATTAMGLAQMGVMEAQAKASMLTNFASGMKEIANAK